MTATDLHSYCSEFWYALGRLDGAPDSESHAENIEHARDFADRAMHHEQPVKELYGEWLGGTLLD